MISSESTKQGELQSETFFKRKVRFISPWERLLATMKILNEKPVLPGNALRRLCRILFLLCGTTFFLSSAYAVPPVSMVNGVLKKTGYVCLVRALQEDSAKRLWIGMFGAGIWVLDGTRARPMAPDPQGHPDVRASKIVRRGSKMIVASSGGGVEVYDPTGKSWKALATSPVVRSRHFHALCPMGKKDWLLGSVGEGIFLSREGVWRNLTQADGLPGDWVNDAIPASGGTWIGTAEGLAFLDPSGKMRMELPERGWRDGNINVLALFRGELYLGTGAGGLVVRSVTADEEKMSSKKKPRFRTIEGIPPEVHGLFSDKERLWVAAEEGFFSIDSKGAAEKVYGPWASGTAFTSVAAYHNGLVVGTADGMVYHGGHNMKWKPLFSYHCESSKGGSRK